jgi:hypothetical protein
LQTRSPEFKSKFYQNRKETGCCLSMTEVGSCISRCLWRTPVEVVWERRDRKCTTLEHR